MQLIPQTISVLGSYIKYTNEIERIVLTENTKVLGWREWVHLPELGLPLIKAKVDSGARTSCLHAFALEAFERDGAEWVKFSIHPIQKNTDEVIECTAPIADKRTVTDSGGHKEERFVIKTRIQIGEWKGDIEMTLTTRDDMMFRVLLGRTAIVSGKFSIDPALSYVQGIKDGHN